MNLLLGDKKQIAVEINDIKKNTNESLTGYARLWINGNFLGTIYDFIYLDGYLLGGLFQMSQVPLLNPEVSKDSFEDLYNYLFARLGDENDYEIHNYLVNFGTMIDNFYVFSFRDNDNITIGWKLIEESNYVRFPDLINYSRTPSFGTMKYSIFIDFIERLERILKAW